YARDFLQTRLAARIGEALEQVAQRTSEPGPWGPAGLPPLEIRATLPPALSGAPVTELCAPSSGGAAARGPAGVAVGVADTNVRSGHAHAASTAAGVPVGLLAAGGVQGTQAAHPVVAQAALPSGRPAPQGNASVPTEALEELWSAVREAFVRRAPGLEPQ